MTGRAQLSDHRRCYRAGMCWGRIYFAAQALAGAAWWVGVILSPVVREATLGTLDPVVVAVLDIPLFVIASALAALGLRAAAVVSTSWTLVVAVALAAYATITTEAGWGVLVMAAAVGGSVIASCLMLIGRVPTEWMLSGPLAFRPAVARAAAPVHLANTAAQILVFWGLFLVAIPLVLAFLEQRWGQTLPFPSIAGPLGLVVLVLASALGLWSAAPWRPVAAAPRCRQRCPIGSSSSARTASSATRWRSPGSSKGSRSASSSRHGWSSPLRSPDRWCGTSACDLSRSPTSKRVSAMSTIAIALRCRVGGHDSPASFNGGGAATNRVRKEGLEPSRPKAQEPKSCVSADFTTPASARSF